MKEKNKSLIQQIEELKQEKNNYKNAIIKLKKACDELKQKNFEKSEALKSIRNFFLTSIIFKVKNMPELETEYKKSKQNKENLKETHENIENSNEKIEENKK